MIDFSYPEERRRWWYKQSNKTKLLLWYSYIEKDHEKDIPHPALLGYIKEKKKFTKKPTDYQLRIILENLHIPFGQEDEHMHPAVYQLPAEYSERHIPREHNIYLAELIHEIKTKKTVPVSTNTNTVLDTKGKRTQWWHSLAPEWKEAFNCIYFKKGTAKYKPGDEYIKKLFSEKTLKMHGPNWFDQEYNQACLKNPLKNLSGIFELRNLEEIDFSFNPITEFNGLFNLQKLTKITFRNCKVSNLNNLANCRNLRELILSSTDLKTMKGIEGLHLDHLDISACGGISSLEPIRNMVSLKKLYCWGNKITSLKDVSNLNQLIELSCHKNHITDISPVSHLYQLRLLSASDNKISQSASFKDLEQLRILLLSNNMIQNITGLGNLNHITDLSLANNELNNLPDFNSYIDIQFPKAKNINIRDNYFDADEVMRLKDFGYAPGQPRSKHYHVLKQLPHKKILNSKTKSYDISLTACHALELYDAFEKVAALVNNKEREAFQKLYARLQALPKDANNEKDEPDYKNQCLEISQQLYQFILDMEKLK